MVQVAQDVKKLETLCTADRNANGAAAMENNGGFPQKCKPRTAL